MRDLECTLGLTSSKTLSEGTTPYHVRLRLEAVRSTSDAVTRKSAVLRHCVYEFFWPDGASDRQEPCHRGDTLLSGHCGRGRQRCFVGNGDEKAAHSWPLKLGCWWERPGKGVRSGVRRRLGWGKSVGTDIHDMDILRVFRLIGLKSRPETETVNSYTVYRVSFWRGSAHAKSAVVG